MSHMKLASDTVERTLNIRAYIYAVKGPQVTDKGFKWALK